MSQAIDDGQLPADPIPGCVYPNGVIEFPISGFSRRERAAIDLCLPQSGTPWLDDMILEAQRQRLAGQALAGLLADPHSSPDMAIIALVVCMHANAVIAELKRTD